MASFTSLPGFRAFYPEEYAVRKRIFQVWRQAARRFGFQEFDGPILEPLDLFKAKSGDEIEEQLFSFVDKGGREVALRPEMTPTLARLVGAKANALKRPIKWFSIGDNFRYERMQRGRLRCFSQLNVDLLGEAGPAADAEVIALLIQMLQSFGLNADDFFVRLSDRRFWLLYLAAEGCEEDEIPGVLGVIDKWERLPEDASLEKLRQIVGDRAGALAEAIRCFIKIDSLEALEAAFAASQGEDLQARLEDWRSLLQSLEDMGLGAFLKIDFGIVRGLAYYTGFVFEAFDKKGELRALAGGGRYDELVKKMGGPELPAVGFGMGDVVLAELLKERGCLPPFIDTIDIYVVSGGGDERRWALADIAALRQAGYQVDYSLKSSSFGKQFKAANASGARMALVYGEEEMARGVVKLRNLGNSEESEVSRGSLLVAAREILEA